jgi:hypothetical protein
MKFDSIVTATLVVYAMLTNCLVVRREFFTPVATLESAEQNAVLLPSWRDYVGKGDQIGPAEAPVRLIEFADFECPFCGIFHKTLKTLRERYPTPGGVGLRLLSVTNASLRDTCRARCGMRGRAGPF